MSTPARNIKIGILPPLSKNLSATILTSLMFQETAAALTGVTGAHSAHFPSLLTSDVTPGGGRRPRPLPAHLASNAPWPGGPGSPYNRRTHKCDYPDCDKVTFICTGLKYSITQVTSLGTDTSRSSSSAHFHSQFGFCPRQQTLFECGC